MVAPGVTKRAPAADAVSADANEHTLSAAAAAIAAAEDDETYIL